MQKKGTLKKQLLDDSKSYQLDFCEKVQGLPEETIAQQEQFIRASKEKREVIEARLKDLEETALEVADLLTKSHHAGATLDGWLVDDLESYLECVTINRDSLRSKMDKSETFWSDRLEQVKLQVEDWQDSL